MRLFVVWTDMDLARGVIERLQRAGHEIAYWVGFQFPPEWKKDFPETIFHEHYDAWEGRPAPELTSADFDPPSSSLIEKFHKTESLILTMMNKHFDWMCVDERKHLYYSILAYWDGVIKKIKPEAIIFQTVPHTVYDYILCELAREAGIKTIMFWSATAVPDKVFLYEDFRKDSAALFKAMDKNKGKVFSTSDLSNEMRKFYEEQTDPARDTTPLYVKEDRQRYAFLNRALLKTKAIMTAFRQGDFVEKTLMRMIKLRKENIREEYERFSSSPDYAQKFVYVPLHYQPECTSSPLGDIFADQILMVKTLSASLPKGWLLYVKEHPSQWLIRGLNFFSARWRGYYEKIAAVRNVRLVPMKTSTYDLIKYCQAVATISGVAGSEALPRGRPVLVFGYPWYRECPGVFRVKDTVSCQSALREISAGFKTDPGNVINFLKCVDEAAIPAYIDGYSQKLSKLSEKENFTNLSAAILDGLKNK